MSIVPPARSMRVGADVRMITRRIIEPTRDAEQETEEPRTRTRTRTRTRNRSVNTRFYNAFVPSAIRRDIGQLLIGSLPGPRSLPEMRSLAKEFSLGGVILFARNIEAPEQVAEMSVDVQGLATDLPLWVSVDQEGGRVARLEGPVHRVAADGSARQKRRRAARRTFCDRPGH